MSIWIVFILYLILRKQGRLRYFVADEILARRKRATIVCWSLLGAMVLSVIVAIAAQINAFFVLFFLFAVALLIAAVVMVPRLRIAKIDKDYIYPKKVHPDAMAAITEPALTS